MSRNSLSLELRTLQIRLAAVPKRARRIGYQIVDDELNKAVERMRHIIMTSGTESTNRPGRTESEKMLNSVSRTPVSNDPYAVSGQFGWLQDPERYFQYQEDGFTHYQTGQWIEGMHAMFDAFMEARENVYRRIAEVTR